MTLKSKIQRNYEIFQQKVDLQRKLQYEAKREKQAQEMKIIEEQIKLSQERKQNEKQQIELENKEIRDKFKRDKDVEQEIIQVLKDQYKKLFESEIDMRDQEHITQDEQNKLKNIPDAIIPVDEAILPQIEADLPVPEASLPQPEVNIQQDEKLASVESEAQQPTASLPLPSSDDMEVDPTQIQIEIPSLADPHSPNEEVKSSGPEVVENIAVEAPQKDNDDMDVDTMRQDVPEQESIETWIRGLFAEILDFVVERKELVTTLEQQKKKWIMWGKKKAKEALEKASKRKTWNLQNKSVSAKTALENVFKEYEENGCKGRKLSQSFIEDGEGEECKATKDYLNDNLIEEVMVPLNLAIFQ